MLTLESNIPLPQSLGSTAGQKVDLPWDDIKVGDSVLVTNRKTAMIIRTRLWTFQKKDRKYTHLKLVERRVKKGSDSRRLWFVAAKPES